MITELHSVEEFTLLLFFHMAHVDGSLHPNERDTILERMKVLFPEDNTLEAKLTKMESSYPSIGDDGAQDLLKDSLKKFPDVAQAKRLEIYSSLFDIINANGRVNLEETNTLQVFKNWLVS